MTFLWTPGVKGLMQYWLLPFPLCQCISFLFQKRDWFKIIKMIFNHKWVLMSNGIAVKVFLSFNFLFHWHKRRLVFMKVTETKHCQHSQRRLSIGSILTSFQRLLFHYIATVSLVYESVVYALQSKFWNSWKFKWK